MDQMCLPLWDQAGYRIYTGAMRVLDDAGDPLDIDVTTGLITGHVGETLHGISTSTGEGILLVVQAGGTVAGYVGLASVVDPATGESFRFRVDSDGKIKY